MELKNSMLSLLLKLVEKSLVSERFRDSHAFCHPYWFKYWLYYLPDWYGLIQGDTIWCDSVTRKSYSNFFAKEEEKKMPVLHAVVEEVKHWKSLIHWTAQTFSARPRFNLCGAQTTTENLLFSWCFPAMICHYSKQHCWHNRHAQKVGERQNELEWCLQLFTFISAKNTSR